MAEKGGGGGDFTEYLGASEMDQAYGRDLTSWVVYYVIIAMESIFGGFKFSFRNVMQNHF